MTKPTAAPPGYLNAADLADYFSELAGRPIKYETVWAFRKFSKPGGRYADNPMPAPEPGSRSLLWKESQRAALGDWFTSRPGQAHGKGAQARGPRGSKK